MRGFWVEKAVSLRVLFAKAAATFSTQIIVLCTRTSPSPVPGIFMR